MTLLLDAGLKRLPTLLPRTDLSSEKPSFRQSIKLKSISDLEAGLLHRQDDLESVDSECSTRAPSVSSRSSSTSVSPEQSPRSAKLSELKSDVSSVPVSNMKSWHMWLMLACMLFCYFVSLDSGERLKFWWDSLFASQKKITNESVLVNEYSTTQWTYFFVLLFVFIANSIFLMIPTLMVVLGRRFERVSKKLARARDMHKHATVEAVLPCFLPNEADIIEDTVWHILSNVESPGDFKLWLVYNTPTDMPDIEARLSAMADRLDLPHGRKLAVVRAKSSKSKAENINLILPQLTAKYTVIYDADHHPDPESLLLLVETIERKGVDCVQGSTYIRNLNAGFLARLIDADFFVTHFLLFPAQRLLTGNAVFEGSNGMWRTKVLQGTVFDKDMQTEDIDVSVRMLLKQHNIEKCPESRSGELAPANWQALFKQRQRWAIGWDQVSLFHFQDILKSDVPRSRKLSVAWTCYSRWLMAVVALISAVLLAPLGIAKQFGLLLSLDAGMLETFVFFLPIGIAISWNMEAIFQIHHRGKQSFIQVFFVLLFWLLAPVYIVFQCSLILTSFWKIANGRDGGWVVTARASTKQGVGYAKNQMLVHDESSCSFVELESQSGSELDEQRHTSSSSFADSELEPDMEPDV